MPKVTLTPRGLALARTALESGLQFPCTRLTVRTKVVSKGDQNCEWVPFTGSLPKRIHLFQVDQTAFNGAISKNPFDFQLFDLKNVQVMRNEQSIPFDGGIPVDSSNPLLLYLTSVRALNDPSRVNFNSLEFANGYGVMCFDVTNDQSAAQQRYKDQQQSGTLKVRLDYSKPLPNAITVFCLAEFDAILVIDHHRNPHWKS